MYVFLDDDINLLSEIKEYNTPMQELFSWNESSIQYNKPWIDDRTGAPENFV